MAKYVLPLTGAALLLGVVAVACGTATVPGIDPQVDGGNTDAGKDTGPGPVGNTDAGGDAGTEPDPNAATYTIGGKVVGLSGTGLVLQNNGGDDLTVNANNTFVFTKKIQIGKTFNVTVKTQPTAPSQVCTVSGASGTVVAANVTTVLVNCSTNTFTVGGTVSGLAGSGLVLQNNNGDDATVGADGQFSFSTPVNSGAPYSVTVKTQPSNLAQTCTVTNESGNVASANVTNVTVTCVTNKYTVGGNVIGLTGSGLVLTNNNGDDYTVGANGAFTFATSQNDGSNFAVAVKTQPGSPQQNCVVSGGTGAIAGGNVSSVVVNCANDKFVISGTVTGLDGSGLVLTNNNGDDVPVNADGGFAFLTALDDLAAYSVAVKTQPTNKWQTCTVANGSGNVAAAPVSNVAITCTTNSYKVKGTVTGLDGSGLVLQNNGGNDLTIPGNGPFEFTTPVASGDGYGVTTLTNPSNKSQTCAVTSGSGTIGGADVENVSVACVTNTYTVGGTVTGLAGGNSVVLQNNGGDDLTVNGDGSFTFNGALESGQSFAVTVSGQPTTPNQTCVVTGDTGTVTAGNVVSVSVNCSTNTYTAGGTVSGLDGTGLVLQNNAGDDVPVNANGTFAFSPQADGSPFAISVKTQPTAKSQTCSVTNGSGNLAGANYTGASIACVTNKYAVGGTVSGLLSGSVVLTNNGGDDLTVNGNGSFSFSTTIDNGSTYAVVIKTQPADRFCVVTSGSGTVGGGPVSSVSVTCTHAQCRTVAGRLWCKDLTPARSCNTFCNAIGFANPTISDTEWSQAQDENSECSAIASSFGIGSVSVASYSYACAEARLGDLACSSYTGCPAAHRTASDGGDHWAVCPCGNQTACGTAPEGGTTTVSCPAGTVIKSIAYASYGTPNGACGSFTDGSCDASNSEAIVRAACVGKNSCSVGANNGVFGDPCGGTVKRLYVQAVCE